MPQATRTTLLDASGPTTIVVTSVVKLFVESHAEYGRCDIVGALIASIFIVLDFEIPSQLANEWRRGFRLLFGRKFQIGIRFWLPLELSEVLFRLANRARTAS